MTVNLYPNDPGKAGISSRLKPRIVIMRERFEDLMHLVIYCKALSEKDLEMQQKLLELDLYDVAWIAEILGK